ncbi:MAG: discoidin domain-containing protein [Silvibacterium sp.]
MSRRNDSGCWFDRCSLMVLLLGVLGAFLISRPMVAAQTSAASAQGTQTDSAWVLSTSDFDNRFEAEPYVGNGHIGLRIPAAGMGFLGNLGKVGWPLGTERVASAIAAGVYAKVADGTFYHDPKDAIALIPTWSTLTFADASGAYSPATALASNVSGYHQALDLRTGIVTTSGTWTSPTGHNPRLLYRVGTDRARGHIAVVTQELTPLWTGTATVSSVLDGAGARRMDAVSDGVDLPTQTIYVNTKAKGTNIPVAESATLHSSCVTSPAQQSPQVSGTAAEDVTFHAQAGRTCTFVKFVAVVTGRESAAPEAEARKESRQAARRELAAFERENRAAWDAVWKADILVDDNAALQQAIRASEYTLYASIAADSPDSLGPSGLSSDGYAGMVFWDADTWMFPALLAQHPDLARVMVDYRSNTLPAARKNAADNGYKGALYPWTSGLSGDMGDECYGAVTNAQGKVTADPNKSCTQQLHLQADVALAQWDYYEATGDKRWLAQRGWPVLQAVAEFWADKATPVAEGYAITQVQTPDEYATDTDNDAYTNAAASLELKAATNAAGILGKQAPPAWLTIASGLIKTMPLDTSLNIYPEHAGYTGQKIKQADVVMLTYPLDFSMPQSVGINNLNYYAPRTDVDGPAMTDAIHSIAAAALDVPGCSAYTYMVRSYKPFLREPYLQFSEFAPVKLSATAYDFLTGVGGFMQEFLYGFSGFRQLAGTVRLDPSLPPQLAGITLRNMTWQGRTFTVHIGPNETSVTLKSGDSLPVLTPGGAKTVRPGAALILPTRRADRQPTDDLSRCRPITASTSLPGSPPVAAVDGSPATAWVAAEPRATLTVTLAAPVEVGKMKVLRGSGDSFGYSVEASLDGVKWTTVHTVPAASSAADEFSLPAVRAKSVRLVFDGVGSANAPSIAELSVFSKKP